MDAVHVDHMDANINPSNSHKKIETAAQLKHYFETLSNDELATKLNFDVIYTINTFATI